MYNKRNSARGPSSNKNPVYDIIRELAMTPEDLSTNSNTKSANNALTLPTISSPTRYNSYLSKRLETSRKN